MDDHHITLEIEYNGRGRLQFELPADATDDEIPYFGALVPRVEQGLLEMVYGNVGGRIQLPPDTSSNCSRRST